MFGQILVPLDGSNLAESALPAVVYLARAFSAKVSLLHLIETNAPDKIHGERHLANPQEASVYLQLIRDTWFPAPFHVDMHVHEEKVEDVGDAILRHAHEMGSDLIIMCTHGSGGLRDLLFGNIAQQVVGRGATPLLLIRPEDDRKMDFTCKKILVPLDGDPEHEQGLAAASALAQACQAELYLLLVVHTLGTLPVDQAATARLLPSATGELLDMLENQAREHMLEKSKELQKLGLSTTAVLARGDPVRSILDYASKEDTAMIVIGTHGKAGINAFWEGSVAPRVSARTHLPLLLVPVKGIKTGGE